MRRHRWTRTIAVGIGIVVIAAGPAAAAVYADRTLRTPSDVRRACALVTAAYGAAEQRSTAVNDNLDQHKLAHPYRVSEVWRTAEQAKLEQAADLLRDRLTRPAPGDRWFNLAWAVDLAARTMDPANQAAELAAQAQAAQADPTAPLPEPSIDVSSAGQDNKLGNAQAACVGRGRPEMGRTPARR